MLTVVKIGGNIIDDAAKLEQFLETFSKLAMPKILVHGGGKLATELGRRLNIEPNYVDGRRITDAPTLELVTMVYGGLINKNIVAGLQKYGCNAIGLTGADGNSIQANKRAAKQVDYGFVGDVSAEGVNSNVVQSLLDSGLVPVLAPLTHDGHGTMLNTNADTIAREVAAAMAAHIQTQLIYCFEKNGVLQDVNNEDAVIRQIHVADFGQLKAEGIISGGMIPKIENACNAVTAGVSRVVIGNADYLNDMINGKTGTEII